MSRPASLQARLLWLLLAVIGGVWTLAALLSWIDTQKELDALLDAHLAQSAALLVAQQTQAAEDDDHEERHGGHARKRRKVDEDHTQAPALHKYASRVVFQVFHDGELTLHSSQAPDTALSTRRRGFDTVTLSDGSAWRVFGAQGADGDVQVFVGEHLRSRRSIVWAVLQGVLTPLLLALPVMAALGWLAVRSSLKPLRSLSQDLAQRRPDALHPLQLQGAPSELAPVLQSLNALFDRIARMLATERRFTADAAHELRTPIAAIRVQAQVALGASQDDALRQQALQQTLAACDRATHLVAQLLTLSRLEAQEAQDAPAPASEIDLGLIVRQVAAELAPAALDRGQTFSLQAEPHCLIAADEALSAVLVRNLLDNALRYSPPGAQVHVSLQVQGGRALLRVDDSGPGLSAADQARLGERFFRVLGTGQSGSGLGWSIVRRIAQVSRARIDLGRCDLGGLCVKVSWPRSDGSADAAGAAAAA